MKILLVAFVSLFVAGCATQSELIVTRNNVVMPNERLFNCPTIKQLPNTESLTDIQVGQLIVQLYKNNETCKASIEAIRDYLIKSKNIS